MTDQDPAYPVKEILDFFEYEEHQYVIAEFEMTGGAILRLAFKPRHLEQLAKKPAPQRKPESLRADDSKHKPFLQIVRPGFEQSEALVPVDRENKRGWLARLFRRPRK